MSTILKRDEHEAREREREWQREQERQQYERQERVAMSCIAKVDRQLAELEEAAGPLRQRRARIEHALTELHQPKATAPTHVQDEWQRRRDDLLTERSEVDLGQTAYPGMAIGRWIPHRGLSFIEADIRRLREERGAQERKVADAKRGLASLR